MKDNLLYIKNPDLFKEIHPTKNGDLDMFSISLGSSKKIWWQCNKVIEHEWPANVCERSSNDKTSCPCCSGSKLCHETSLGFINPELSKEWHPTLNSGLTPFDVFPYSHKKAWWLCEKNHSYDMAISNKHTKDIPCVICSNKRLHSGNSLSAINPKLASEWHITKNDNLTPNDVMCGSNKKVWWTCVEHKHDFEAIINDRHAKESQCPYCTNKLACIENCLATMFPSLLKEWDYEKNKEITPYNIISGTSKKVFWKCYRGHSWDCRVVDRCGGSNCPDCHSNGTSYIEKKFYYFIKLLFPNTINRYKLDNDGKRKVEIDIFIPEINLGIEYDGVYYHNKPEKIIKDIEKNKFIANKNIFFLRIRESGLPFIHDNEIHYDYSHEESFENTIREILNFIYSNFNLNGEQKNKITEIKNINFDTYEIPNDFFEHYIRTNSILVSHPNLAAEWDYVLNGSLRPEHVSYGSTISVNWKCEKFGHQWKTTPNSRTSRNHNCPTCSRLSQNKSVTQHNAVTGEIINTFISITLASSMTNVKGCNISMSCRNDRKTAGGFKWRYV